MNTQLINLQSWRPTTVATTEFVVRAYGFGMRAVSPSSSHLVADMTNKHRAAAAKATAKGLQPWSPPVT